ncbi:MAG: homoserine kinase [Terracidiphilus sp.]
MIEASAASSSRIRLRLPATSANLGPGFDAAAIALDFYLELEAEPAPEFSIAASGRDWQRCAEIKDNLVLGVYSRLLEGNGRPVVPLAIRMTNEIPLGMGCGSSAAARLGAIALAVYFGGLAWDSDRIIDEAYKLEGHPDNVAACWLGGLVTAACEGTRVRVLQVRPPDKWRAIVALPAEPLSTTKARNVLPAEYPREDVVANIQSAAMLGLAFAEARGDLLRIAMADRIHQPYRAPFCPLLPLMLPLVGREGILGVALSGAGPAVLAVIENQARLDGAARSIYGAAEGKHQVELLVSRFTAARENITVESETNEGLRAGETLLR